MRSSPSFIPGRIACRGRAQRPFAVGTFAS
jgi:hypothetical protein